MRSPLRTNTKSWRDCSCCGGPTTKMRLGQLIGNFFMDTSLYNCEDFTLIERLEPAYAALAAMRTTP